MFEFMLGWKLYLARGSTASTLCCRAGPYNPTPISIQLRNLFFIIYMTEKITPCSKSSYRRFSPFSPTVEVIVSNLFGAIHIDGKSIKNINDFNMRSFLISFNSGTIYKINEWMLSFNWQITFLCGRLINKKIK